MERRRPLVTTLVAALAAVALGACSAPSHRFVASPQDDVILKLPRSWTKVYSGVPPAQASGGATASPEAGAWVAVYDASRTPKLDNVQNQNAPEPVALMRTWVLTEDMAGAVTDDKLRDLVLPVTDAGREAAQLTGQSEGTFKRLIDSETISTKTSRGVRVVYSYDFGQGEVVYDQIVITDPKKTKLHLFFVHCTKACYDANRAEISGAVSSVTLKRP